MNTISDPKQATVTKGQIQGLMAALVVQFVLGVALTTLIDYDPKKPTAIQTTFLVLHIIVATGILLGATARLALATRGRFLQASSTFGLLAVLVAFANGIAAAKTGNDVFVFFMAMGFIAAFSSYGYGLGKVTDS